jgi:phosphoribosyl 1,2-cyclic phosphate phosphodiesterase
MEILFLGTGAAWSLPEYSCRCATCTKMKELGEERTRTSFVYRGAQTILVDCGPDIRSQMWRNSLDQPDLILITHGHGDHYLGLDDLLVFRRSMPKEAWSPIPVYATEQTWDAIELRFGYLIGSLIEKRVVTPGVPLDAVNLRITPFKTFHGLTSGGPVGYVLEESSGTPFKLVYTSDFMRLDEEPACLEEPDVLIIQSHWLNEPEVNRPHHMSFQKAMDYIRRWRPKRSTFLVHISDADQIPGDSCNNFLKKCSPANRLAHPASGEPYPVPRCHQEWQNVVDRICKDYGLPGPVIVARDGLKVAFDPGGTS